MNGPAEQHLYVINVATNEGKCLTCEMETPEGSCRYASGIFSKDLSHFVKICQGPGPYLVQIQEGVDVRTVTFQTRSFSYIFQENTTFVWEDNQALREKLLTKLQPIVVDLTVPVANGFEANVRMLLPPDVYDTNNKYPAIVNV